MIILSFSKNNYFLINKLFYKFSNVEDRQKFIKASYFREKYKQNKFFVSQKTIRNKLHCF